MRIRFGRNIARAALACAVLLVSALLLFADGPPQYSPWSQAVAVGPPITTPLNAEACPFIAKNGLDLYFRTLVPFGSTWRYDIFVSHRDSVEDPWETPINLGPNINTPASTELCSFVTNDGHWIYFVSNRTDLPSCGGHDIWVSHRQDKRNDQGWETPKNLGCIVNSSVDDNGPVLFEDEATGQTSLYFTSYRAGGQGGSDIYASTMVGDDRETFGPPSPVVELNTAFNDLHAFVQRKDGLEVIFSSNRTGTIGGNDLWSSTRPDSLSPWSTPVNLGPLVNSNRAENRPSISWDGTTLYFWTDREWVAFPGGGWWNMDVYQATRTKLPD